MAAKKKKVSKKKGAAKGSAPPKKVKKKGKKKKKQAQMGRPSKLTKTIQDAIYKDVEAGNYIEAAAASAGVARQTVHDWMRTGARLKEAQEKGEKIDPEGQKYIDFSDTIKKGQAIAEKKTLSFIEMAAKCGYWQAGAWRLERMYKHWRMGGEDLFDSVEVAEMVSAIIGVINRVVTNAKQRKTLAAEIKNIYEGVKTIG